MRGQISIATESAVAEASGEDRSSRSADRAYQMLTIAAILVVLGSLWVF